MVRSCWNYLSYYSKRVRHCFKKFLEIQIFTEIGRSQSLYFFSVFAKFNPVFLHESGCSKIAKSRPYLVSIFQEKYDYFLSYFVLFLLKKGAWLKIKRLESKSDLPYFSLTILGHNPVQTVSSQHVLILSLLVTEVVFFLNFRPLFQVCLFF